eukprot:COSAG05_NODE_3378_length_2100_cov_3.102319_5_plen_68_part_01
MSVVDRRRGYITLESESEPSRPYCSFAASAAVSVRNWLCPGQPASLDTPAGHIPSRHAVTHAAPSGLR